MEKKVTPRLDKYLEENNTTEQNDQFCKELTDSVNSVPYLEGMRKHYTLREKALEDLGNIFISDPTTYSLNVDFLDHFGDYFANNYSCLCDPGKINSMFAVKEFAGKGKIGSASFISIPAGNDPSGTEIRYVLKRIATDNFDILSDKQLKVNYVHTFDKAYLNYSPSIAHNWWPLPDAKDTGFGMLTVGFKNGFHNQTLIHMVLNKILKDNIQNYIYQYDAFYCKVSGNLEGWNIAEAADADLSAVIEVEERNVNSEFILNILRQVLLPFSFLKSQKYGFVHADCKCKNVFAKRISTGTYIFKIADFDKSSIFWKGIRFYNNSPKDAALSKGPELFYNGYIPTGDYYVLSSLWSKTMQKISVSAVAGLIQYYTMHTPYPIFMSYDVYTFVLSLLREPIIFNFITTHIMDLTNRKAKGGLLGANKILLDILNSLFEDLSNIINAISRDISEYITENNAANKKELLRRLRSLSYIIYFMTTNNIHLKINIDPVYELLDLPKISDIDTEISNFHRTHEKIRPILHIHNKELCVKNCKN